MRAIRARLAESFLGGASREAGALPPIELPRGRAEPTAPQVASAELQVACADESPRRRSPRRKTSKGGKGEPVQRCNDREQPSMQDPCVNQSPRRRIAKVSEDALASMYEIHGQVMESVHRGVQVLAGNSRRDGTRVVVKTHDKSKSFHGSRQEREWRKNACAQLNTPEAHGLCQYLAVYETEERYYVIMERAVGSDLGLAPKALMRQSNVKETPCMQQEDVRQILFQVLLAVQVMHGRGRVHRDLKLENVVVDFNSCTAQDVPSPNGLGTTVKAKLIDFDTVTDWQPESPKHRRVVGTDGYIAPESYGGEYSPASDMYGMGVIMYRLLTGKAPLKPEIFASKPAENAAGSKAMRRIRQKIEKATVDFRQPPFSRCPQAKALVQALMSLAPGERPSAEEALRHAWFAVQGDERPAAQADAVGKKFSLKSTADNRRCPMKLPRV